MDAPNEVLERDPFRIDLVALLGVEDLIVVA
jgi:hypothetical protein